MAEDTPPGGQKRQKNEANWARPITSLLVSRVPTGSLNLNVDGRQVVGPLQGFGRLWQKTFRLCLPNTTRTPAEVMQIWKANFPRFQPAQNRFFPVTTLDPGEIMLINASMIGMPVFTGMMVLYADDESFTLMTPQGHPESGWVTFSTFLEDDQLICQVQTMTRANDPLYEYSFRLFGSRAQDRIWTYVLEALAVYLRENEPTLLTISSALEDKVETASDEPVTLQVHAAKVCLDPRVQWSEVKNIWQNAAIRTILYTLSAPIRWVARKAKRNETSSPPESDSASE